MNPFERAARAEKVAKIVAIIPMATTAKGNAAGARFLAGLAQVDRDIFARMAGQLAPSEATWAMVVEAVRNRRTPRQATRAMRQFLGTP